MIHKELNRLEILQRALDKRITQTKAAQILAGKLGAHTILMKMVGVPFS